jgi:TonB family protein
MAHYPRPEPDPDPDLAQPGSSAGKPLTRPGHLTGQAERLGFESDLGQLKARFASREGGNLSAELSADLALEVVLNEIVEQACLATGATGAAIILERDGEMVCRASGGINAPELGARLGNPSGLTAECIRTRRVQRCADAERDPRADIQACRNLGVRSLIVLPLLRNGELVGVFEVFSSYPSGFGERDERTLEALSMRVLSNLARASEPVLTLLAAEPNPTVEHFKAEHSIAEPMIAEPLIGEDAIAGDIVEEGLVEEGFVNPSAVEPGAVATNIAADNAERVDEESRTGSSSRGINVITWILGAAVLAAAVLLTTIVAQRLLGAKAATRRHPPTVLSATSAGVENEHAAAGGAQGTTPSPADGTSSAVGGTFDPAPPGSSPLAAAASGRTAPAAGSVRASGSAPPEGSLMIYENGKEVFRMAPAADTGEATNAAAGNGGDLTSTSGGASQPASAVERAGIYELSPQAAERSLLYRVEPDYPEGARQRQIQGPVVLEVRAGHDGAVEEVKLVSGQRELADAAIAAVKQWRFRPRIVGGHPVEIQTKVILNFRLPR